jgi:DNA-binding protein HU-beta
VPVNKSDLIDNVVQATGVAKKETEKVVDALFSTVKAAVKKGERVAWPNFGAFSLSERKARTGRNPQTGEPVEIPATNVAKVTVGSKLKAAAKG